jgi:hypothetical protein
LADSLFLGAIGDGISGEIALLRFGQQLRQLGEGVAILLT